MSEDHSQPPPPIEAILNASTRTKSEIGKILEATVGDWSPTTALFGSYARREAGPLSDIDIIIVWDREPPPDTAVEAVDEAGERIHALTGNRAQLMPMTFVELKRLAATRDPLVDALRTDSEPLTEGSDLNAILTEVDQ
jgi:predicted nucleotidyltransferase